MSDADSALEKELLSDSGSGVKRASDQSGVEDQPAPKKSNVPSSERELNEGETRESFPIPDQLVGLVIGRGGENIQRVQSTTNCEIQVLPSSDGSNERPCTLTGTPEAVTEAKKMLQDTIANGQMKDEENRKTPRTPSLRGGLSAMRGRGGSMRGGYNPSAPRFTSPNGTSNPPRFNIAGHGYNPYQQTTEDFLVPSDKIGVAIGKGGQNLKNLRTKFNVNLELVQGDTDPPGVAKPLRITGSLGQINATRMDCFTSMLSKEEKTQAKQQPGAQVRSDFPVPQDAVGVIIGKKGETITSLQGETQTRVQFQPEDPNGKTRGCYVTGLAESVMKAQQIILNICRKKMLNAEQTKQTFAPPGMSTGPPQIGAPTPPMPQQPGQMPWSQPQRSTQPGVPSSPYQSPQTGAYPGHPPHPSPAPPMAPPQSVADQKVDYPVPSSKTGAVIGKGGEHIIGIKNQTGCQITQNKTNPPSNDPQWKYFTIQGPPDKVALAQKLIQERVGGPPPPGASFAASPQQPTPPHGMMAPPTRPAYNPQAPPPVNFGQSAPPPASPMVPPSMPTPPPVYGGAAQPGAPPVVPHQHSPYGGAAGGYPQPPAPQTPQAPPPQAPTPQSQSSDHSAAWAAYYQQMYSQQKSTQSTSNATSGQPDYTKAWEEYFKQQQNGQQNGSATQPAAAAAATSNGGQPDYSAAWAEYYKTMGQYQQYYNQQRT